MPRSSGARAGLSFVVAVVVGIAWILVGLYPPKALTYNGNRQYQIAFHAGGLDLAVSRCFLQTVHQRGCIGLIVSETAVSCSGIGWQSFQRHGGIGLSRTCHVTDIPTIPLPAPRVLPDGSTQRSGLWMRGWRLTIPWWFIFTAAMVQPTRWLVCCIVCRRRLARRAAFAMRGRCVDCGYDLRATPLRCPECGSLASAGH